MHYDPAPMGRQEAESLLANGTYFDYLKGRVMKVDLGGHDEFSEFGYDRDNGEGAAERAISSLRAAGNSAAASIEAQHKNGLAHAAEITAAACEMRTSSQSTGGVAGIKLGLADVKEVLLPKIKAAIAKKH